MENAEKMQADDGVTGSTEATSVATDLLDELDIETYIGSERKPQLALSLGTNDRKFLARQDSIERIHRGGKEGAFPQ